MAFAHRLHLPRDRVRLKRSTYGWRLPWQRVWAAGVGSGCGAALSAELVRGTPPRAGIQTRRVPPTRMSAHTNAQRTLVAGNVGNTGWFLHRRIGVRA